MNYQRPLLKDLCLYKLFLKNSLKSEFKFVLGETNSGLEIT